MKEGVISTHAVRATPDGRGVEVVATLDAGEVVTGMFLHVPLNAQVDFTVRITAVRPDAGDRICLILDCGDSADDASLVMAFNFAGETLSVMETGEA